MDEKTRKILLGVFVGLSIVLFAVAIFIRAKYLNEINDLNTIISAEAQKEYDLVKKFAAFIEPTLSEDGKASLVIVANYINENPNVLVGDNSNLPDEVADALANIKEEVKINFGEIINGSDSNNATAGQQVVVTGILNEYANENPYGATYTITDNTTGATYYFLFGEETINTINDENMVGQEVTVTIQMTGTGQEFTVVSGPTLVETE